MLTPLSSSGYDQKIALLGAVKSASLVGPASFDTGFSPASDLFLTDYGYVPEDTLDSPMPGSSVYDLPDWFGNGNGVVAGAQTTSMWITFSFLEQSFAGLDLKA